MTRVLVAALLACSACNADGLRIVGERDNPCAVGACAAIGWDGATPNGLTVTWKQSELPPGVRSFLLWYGSDAAAVRARQGPAAAWGVAQDLNLGWQRSPFGAQEVERTTLRGLAPATTYSVDLWTWFDDGTAARVATGSATTPPAPTVVLPIFDDALPSGATLTCLQVGLDSSDAGNPALLIDTVSDPAQCGEPWVNLKLLGIRIDLSGLDAQAWQGLYLELEIRVDDISTGAPVPYVEVALSDTDARIIRYAVPRYLSVPAAAGWQRYQIPLSAMEVSSGVPADASSFGPIVDFLQVGGRWGTPNAVVLDSIALKY